MAQRSFQTLWENHPARQTPEVLEPCSRNGTPLFQDQCAIRLGTCLVTSGISLASYKGVFCWYGHGRQHPLRAEEMKLWLNSASADFVATAEIAKRTKQGNQVSYHAYLGRTGIVMFRNFWGANNQGDHIDLWDGSQVAHGDRNYFHRSQEIWFWEMR